MKRLIIVLAALAISLTAAAGEQGGYVTKDYGLKNFTGISVSGIVNVDLKKSDSWGVSVNLPEELVEYLIVEVKGRELVIGFKSIPLKIQKRLRNWRVTADVSMPLLTSLEMSGATKLTSRDPFDIGDLIFKMELSGASKAKGLDMTAKGLDLETGGAAGAEISGVFDYADIEMSGASKCEFNITSGKLDHELSGAAKAYHEGEFDIITLDASGAGVFSLKGKARKFKVDASGAVKVDAFNADILDAVVSFSGAAYGEINATGSLRIEELGGGSSVRYKDNDGLDLNIVSMGRGASLKRVAKD
ncbi:MAG: DUF2807 domain-containing protein [Bacteroidales bacterium]|nr:DUF2807 domain-containing protein [Bacteroidales bacterium]